MNGLIKAESLTGDQRYEHFFYNNLDLACFANLEGYFEELNRNFTRVLGYTAKDLLDKKFFEFIHPDDIASTLKEMEKLSLGFNTVNFINRFKTKSSTYRYLEWNSTVNLETRKIYAVARDVTEKVVSDNELTFQNVENEKRAAELVIANKELAFQHEEKEKRASELGIANKELVFQNDEKEKRAAELIIANEELGFQNHEKEKRAAELIVANKELVFQNEEKEKRAAELLIANKELVFQNEEKEKRAAELIIANKELLFQNEEKGKRAAELFIANRELVFQSEEKEKRASELVDVNKKLVFKNEEKEKTEQELTQSERRLSRAQQLAHIGSWEIDMVDNTQTWSDGMYKIYGINNKEQGSIELFLSLVHPDDLTFATNKIVRSFSILSDSSFNFRFFRKDGEIRFGYSEYRFEFDQNKRPIRLHGIIQDLSEQKKAEEDLLHSENRFRALIEKGADMIALRSPEGKVFYASPSILLVLGYTIEELSRNSIFELIHPDDLSWLQEQTRAILEIPGSSFFCQQRYLHKNGTWIWCEGTVTNMLHEPGIQALVSNFRDISEKKLAELQMEFDRNNLTALINNTDDLMWSVDKDFKLITSNQQCDEMIRLLSGKVIEKGGNMLSLGFSPEKVIDYKRLYERAFDGETFTEILYNTIPKDMWSEVSYYPIRKGDEVIGTACFSRDVTERKLAELERIKITNDLVQRNKDLEQFTYIISHNLRAPIANILGITGMISDDGLTAEEKYHLTEGLNESVTKLDDVVGDLNEILHIERVIDEVKEKVSFSELVENVKLSTKDILDGIDFEIRYDFSGVDGFLTLKSYLYSIFHNLISNSMKYRQQQLHGIIEIASHLIDGKIRLIFKDNGMGIDLQGRGDQVFGLYKRFHTNIEGKGMGLFMVKTQVETLGGKITVKSEVNKGTEFTIDF